MLARSPARQGGRTQSGLDTFSSLEGTPAEIQLPARQLEAGSAQD